MTVYADYFQIGSSGTKYYVRDREAREGLLLKADINSPTFTGEPTAPTPASSDKSQKLATTQYVNDHTFYSDATLGNANAGYHNSLFRGKYLGNSYTAAQQAAVSAGNFANLFLGDYWTINNINWRIAGFNYWLRKGDTECTTPHLLIFPDSNLLKADGSTTHYMNDTNTTEGGYKATKMRSTYLSQCLQMAAAAFGSGHILNHRELITNAVSNGQASGWEWVSTQIEIPGEVQIFGSGVWGNSTIAGHGHNVGVNHPLFPLFQVAPQYMCNREAYWLRDVVSASIFAVAGRDGASGYGDASGPWSGVRPYFLLS